MRRSMSSGKGRVAPLSPSRSCNLDLELARKFNSRYSLALYENCFRYRKIKRTPWRQTRDWVLLIAGPDLYRDYREFKRTALKKAMDELQNTPSCSITVVLEEERGQFNRVDRIRFVIVEKAQAAEQSEMPPLANHALAAKLAALGVSSTAIEKLLADYDHAYIEAQLDLTLREHARGRLNKPAAWFMDAVERRFDDQITEHERAAQKAIESGRQQEAAAALATEFNRHRMTVAMAWFQAFSAPEQTALEKEFLVETNETTRARFTKDRVKSKMVESSFRLWLCKQEGACTGLGTKDRAGYLATRPRA